MHFASANASSVPFPVTASAGMRYRLVVFSVCSSLRMLREQGPFDLVYERYALWSSAGVAYATERGIPSVLEVRLAGGLEREVQVDVDLAKLKFYDVSYDDVVEAVPLVGDLDENPDRVGPKAGTADPDFGASVFDREPRRRAALGLREALRRLKQRLVAEKRWSELLYH